MQGGCE